MTWEELKEKAQQLGYQQFGRTTFVTEWIKKDGLIFYESGLFVAESDEEDPTNGVYKNSNRTYDQMYQIMLALED
jgi:effector-binding domain-containing protein